MAPRRPQEEQRRALPRTAVPDDVIKSCGRTLQILEYMDDVKRPVTAIELVEALNYPQSSVSALLRSMVLMGFLHANNETRQYLPTLRVLFLGHWIDAATPDRTGLLKVLETLAAETGDSIALATRRSLHAQYIHVVQASGPDRLKMTTGALLPLANSGSGFALLSGYSKEYIRRIVARSNAEHLYTAEPFNVAHIQQRVDLVRSQGFAYEVGLVNPDGAVLSFPLSIIEGNAPLVLTIGGQKRSMPSRLPELLRVTREVLNSFDASLLPISDTPAQPGTAAPKQVYDLSDRA